MTDSKNMSIEELIAELGGPKDLARELMVTTSAVNAWKYNMSIPSKHWVHLSALAKKRGYSLTILPDYNHNSSECFIRLER